MLISIIIPFYNIEAHIAEAIESVISQTYPNWELLLIDDGSIDSGTSIALEYCNKYKSKIIYLSHEGHQNKGLAASRNLGLKEAKGEYVALLDADDVWLPEKLTRQVEIAVSHPDVAFISGASLYWYSWKGKDLDDVIIPVGCEKNKVILPPLLFFQLYPIGKGAAPCPSGMLIKTEVLRRHEGFVEYFKGEFQVYEDQGFLTKFYLSDKCYFSGDYYDKYRQRSGSLVNEFQSTGTYLKVRLYFLEWLEGYLEKNSIHNNDIRNAVSIARKQIKFPFIYKINAIVARIYKRIMVD